LQTEQAMFHLQGIIVSSIWEIKADCYCNTLIINVF
jgi:hypothetical protein